MYLQSEILSPLASVMGRTEKGIIFVSTEGHGRKPRRNCVGLLPGTGTGVSSEQWRKWRTIWEDDCTAGYGCVSGNRGNCQRPVRENRKDWGGPEWKAREGTYSRKSYWRMSKAGRAKERLICWGSYDLAIAHQSVHVNYWKRGICEPYVRCCERTRANYFLLLDSKNLY